MRIFFISLLLLFTELAIIRWIGTEVNVFAFLQNVLLICCFMGFGIGMCSPHRGREAQEFTFTLFILLVLTSVPFFRHGLSRVSVAVSALGRSFVAWNLFDMNEMTTYRMLLVVVGMVLIALIMFLVTMLFVPIGTWLGKAFAEESRPLKAYAYNLLGSLAGTWCFYLGSAFTLPPFVWFLVVSVLTIVWLKIRVLQISPLTLLMLCGIPAMAAIPHFAVDGKLLIWSPYQKLLVRDVHAPPALMEGQWILVNNSGYQIMLDLRPEALRKRPDLYQLAWEGYTQYDLPLRFNPRAKSALFLGAGSGNDAAAAVRADVSRIVAVDIDPVIVKIGRDFHPEHPYADPKVQVEVTDARSYLASSREKFDVISFGLLDSHTTGQMTNARLDHFVYTREAITNAAARLSPGGIMTLTFEASKAHISDRIRVTLREVFHHEPLVLRIPATSYSFGGVMFVTGNVDSISQALTADPKLLRLKSELAYEVPELGTAITTDDWPYIYLEAPSIPPLFLVVSIMAVLVFIILSRKVTGGVNLGRMQKSDLYFALLGAAFLLLEIASISRVSIVLGIAWQPIAAIVTGIMLMALFANALILRWSPPPIIPLVGVVISCLLLYLFDFANLLTLPYSSRFAASAMIACVPTFFSGMLFSSTLANAADPPRALAMNGLGAAVGATLQCCSLVFGMRFLLILVAGLYLLAGLYLPGGVIASGRAVPRARREGR